ncbi:MAG: hypothetical protein RL199_1041, partial [Pseudomonadota bacterium]|jgi:hypothetical protein
VAWGQSFVAGNSDKAQLGMVELAGFSPVASPLGMAMPLEAARRLNRDLGRDATPSLRSSFVSTHPSASES